MFTVNEAGDGAGKSQSADVRCNPLFFTVPSKQPSIWNCNRYFHASVQNTASPISLYSKLLKPRPWYRRSSIQRPTILCSLLPVNTSQVICYQKPQFSVYTESMPKRFLRQPSVIRAVGSGDASISVDASLAKQAVFPPMGALDQGRCPRDTEETRISDGTASTAREIEATYRYEKSVEKTCKKVSGNKSGLTEIDLKNTNSESDQKKQKTKAALEEFLVKISETYDKLNYRDSWSSTQFRRFVDSLLAESRNYFYKLESVALCEILQQNGNWNSMEKLADIFDHDYFSMADILSMYVLQLILAYTEYGYIDIDPSVINPLSILSFYRGEFRIGRVLPGVYQMHVTSYQYTTCTAMMQTSSPCPLKHDSHVSNQCTWQAGSNALADLQHWSYCERCDPFHSHRVKENTDVDDEFLLGNADIVQYVTNEVASSQDEEDARQLLKILCWRVRFMQNPDLEEENYYLCCKPVQVSQDLSENASQSQPSTYNYYFGKLVSVKLNFVNPSLEEIALDCRPSGHFAVLHSFGEQLPVYSTAVGILVDYLRNKRFNRTVF